MSWPFSPIRVCATYSTCGWLTDIVRISYHAVPGELFPPVTSFRIIRSYNVSICDKKTGKARQAAIKAVAQEAGFYAPEVEKQLNTHIEMPGNRVIDKLLRAKPISEEERLDLSAYIATMLKRVPHRRKKAYALIPASVDDTKQKLPQQLTELAVRRGLPLADPEQALTEANLVVEGILTSVPKPIEDYIRTP